MCIFLCFLRARAHEDAKSHWSHVLDFSPLCIFKCALKLPACEDAKSHWLLLLVFPPRWVFNGFSNYLHQRMHSRIGCICLAFLHCVFSNVPSNRLPEKRHNHIGCICLIYFHCKLFSSGFLHLHSLKQSHNFPFFYSQMLCVVLCPNGCFKLS